MEQPVETRYVFIMLLAIADAQGHVIGTDTALARRINVPLETYQRAIEHLSQPDPDSNSPDEEGKRIVPSDKGRGWRIVNYLRYRDARDERRRREYMRGYMREYMKERRACKGVRPVKHVKQSLAQAEAEAEADRDITRICDSAANKPTENADSPRAKAFKRPSLAEVKALFCGLGLDAVEAETFFDHFQSNGWKVGGKAPMKDLAAAARNWKRRKGQLGKIHKDSVDRNKRTANEGRTSEYE